MNKKVLLCVTISIAMSVAITLVSGLYLTPISHGIDVIYRGIPIPWIMTVIPRPSSIIWLAFVEDIMFWILITIIPLLIIFARNR
ncbi:MAG: hypothetical protein ABSF09_00260 [Candidatus Bathyarchaeia archaeon]|jgi:hypothetical protein